MSLSLETAIANASHGFILILTSITMLQLLATSGVIIYKLSQQKTGWLTWFMLSMLWISYVCDIIGEIFYCLAKHHNQTNIKDYIDFNFEDNY